MVHSKPICGIPIQHKFVTENKSEALYFFPNVIIFIP